MTGKEDRDLGYIKWKDPLAWMENMKGARWNALVTEENRHFQTLVNDPQVKKRSKVMEEEIIDASQYTEGLSYKIGGGSVVITMMNEPRFLWKWAWLKRGIYAYDVDVQGNIAWYVTSDEEKTNKNELICADTMGKKIWTKKAVSSQIAIINNLCYYIKMINDFRTVELCVCNAQTGNEERVIYREKDAERDLILYKNANRTLYLKSIDPIRSILYRVQGLTLIPLFPKSILQFTLGESIYGDDCIMTRNRRCDPWITHGKPITSWILPEEEIVWMNLESGHLITINEGAHTIWFLTAHKKPRKIFYLRIGSIEANPWTDWENSVIQTFIIKCPFEVPFLIHIINNKIIRDIEIIPVKHPIHFPTLTVHRFHTPAPDGTMIPYITVIQKGIKPKAQLIYVYGAYGASTVVDWPFKQWGPLLRRKWAITFAMVRGGGDKDEMWAEAVRRENRHIAVDDFEAVIRGSQKKLQLSADKTVIYGRSAGGLPVGAIVARYPQGELVGAAFTEVPYVDILRTSSNPDLPLTVGEYKEFGNPRENILHFKALLSISPMNTLTVSGAPGVFVLSRVGLLDRQVLAYESFKWIQHLRGSSPDKDVSCGKYVYLVKNEGHQHLPKHFSRFCAIDLAILDAWADQAL